MIVKTCVTEIGWTYVKGNNQKDNTSQHLSTVNHHWIHEDSLASILLQEWAWVEKIIDFIYDAL